MKLIDVHFSSLVADMHTGCQACLHETERLHRRVNESDPDHGHLRQDAASQCSRHPKFNGTVAAHGWHAKYRALD